jgi:hypothetical protein
VNRTAVNRNYKDSVFTALFRDEEKLVSLYNALTDGHYRPDAQVRINTLEDVLFKEQLNDLSFTIEDRLVVLIEHQSTINENMPLRCLLYLARVYEKILSSRELYRKRLVRIPMPEFYVLFNGTQDVPDRQVLCLSDAFREAAGRGAPMLELEVTVVNINYGRSPRILEKDRNLGGYSYFIHLVRSFQKEGLTKEESVGKAVQDCIRQNILKEFLTRNGSEVENMLTAEWDWKVAEEVWREEAFEEGLERGKLEAARKMLEEKLPVSLIRKVTGLDTDTIKSLQ